MAINLTISIRTWALGGAALAVAAGAYLVGTASRPAAPAQTLTYVLPASDQTSNAAMPGITVSGTGTVNGTPDTLTLQLTVTQTKADVSDALSAASSTMNSVDSALTGAGVANADLRTTGASVQPHYRSGSGGSSIDGYTASESLTATLHDLHKAGSQIDTAVQAGGNAVSVDGVSLDLQNDSSLMSSARSAAYADAEAKAQQYASAAHETLGKAIQVTETVSTPTPIYENGMAASSAAAVPVKAGTEQLSVTVTVVFAAS